MRWSTTAVLSLAAALPVAILAQGTTSYVQRDIPTVYALQLAVSDGSAIQGTYSITNANTGAGSGTLAATATDAGS